MGPLPGADAGHGTGTGAPADPASRISSKNGIYLPKEKTGKWRSMNAGSGSGTLGAEGSVRESLNGKVTRHVGRYAKYGHDKKIYCRHFAIAYALTCAKKPSDLFHLFSFAEGIASFFGDSRLEESQECEFDFMSKSPPETKQVLLGSQLGQYMAQLAEALPETACVDGETGQSEVRCLLLTANHSMALQVQRKTKQGREETFVARVYDPSITGNASRCVRNSAQALEDLDLQQMLLVAAPRDHLADDPLNVYDNKECVITAVCTKPAIARQLGRIEQTVSSAGMFAALSSGSTLDFRAILDKIDDRRSAVFNATMCSHVRYDPESTLSGLHVAMQDGFLDTVKDFVKEVLMSGQDIAGMKFLLDSESECYGKTALGHAMSTDASRSVAAFVETVIASGEVDGAEKVDLLGRKSLSMALRSGNLAAAERFIELVSTASDDQLTTEHKDELLAESGTQAIILGSNASEEEDKEEIDNIFRTVRKSVALTEDRRNALLAQVESLMRQD